MLLSAGSVQTSIPVLAFRSGRQMLKGRAWIVWLSTVVRIQQSFTHFAHDSVHYLPHCPEPFGSSTLPPFCHVELS